MSCRTPHSLLLHRPRRLHASTPSLLTRPCLRAIHKHKSPQRNNLINPPASTRPPPLSLPNRESESSFPSYLFKLGKAYITFYKDGVKAVLANRRLLNEKLAKTPANDRPSIFNPGKVPKTFSRADWVLMWRVRHDLIRLPVFGLMLLVIGEFTVLVVALVDGVVPYTCRIPRQVYSGLKQAEARREASFKQLEAYFPYGAISPGMTPLVARSHVLRSLNLASNNWDRLSMNPGPGSWSFSGAKRLAFLEGDDKNLVEDGGLVGLEIEELRIACAERGIDVLGRSEADMRAALGDWLRLTAAKDDMERKRRMAVLLLTRFEQWPETREFALPEWTL